MTLHKPAILLCATLAVCLPRTSPAAEPPTFAADIQPLFKARCWQCHGESVQKSGLALHTPAAIRKGGESGPVLIAGKPDESPLYERVHAGEMPPDKKNALTTVEVATIRRWIESGANLGDDPSTTKPALSQHDVLPILLLRCTACHGAQKQEGGLDLRTRSAMLKGGKAGPAFVPGKPTESRMVQRILAEEMPPRARLTEVSVKPMEAEELKKLQQWIAAGAPEVPDEPDVAGTEQDPLVKPADREFWSFKPPQQVAVPLVQHPEQVANPIDAFLLEKLEQKGLTFSPVADRLTLIRRVTFDLTGLPPDPAEAQEFLADARPDAYERLVDRLLASPRYGERWARRWLDVAGYADCEGRREQHLPRPVAWRYRDYVIRAHNADKPYDRFLVEQLAGDELADYANAQQITQELEDNLVATAFLRMSPDPTWANLTGFVPDRLEVMADVIDVLGSGVMGLTFKCARCHTHKFDPIPQRDYYRLVAVFKGAYDEHDWLKPELMGYGGALSAGSGDRYLPHVTSAEQQRWRDQTAMLQKQIEALKAQPTSPEIEKQIKDLEGRKTAAPKLMALLDRGQPSPTYLYRRGDYQNPGSPVGPGAPAVLMNGRAPLKIEPPWPGAKSTGRRLAFARWLTSPDHPLTVRVFVNRQWKHHFGQGLVHSLGNFGKTGDRPTHPELLDWLAREFVQQGFHMKALHRLMVTSNAYRQSSLVTQVHQDRDPTNQWLSRMPLRRLEAEELRDTLLALAGGLDETRFGPADPVQIRTDGLVLSGNRRSIYVQQLRKHPASLLETFDLPSMNPNCLQRTDSLVAPQALQLLNDPAVRAQAERFAERIIREAGADSASQIDRLYWLAFTRPPSAEEQTVVSKTLAEVTQVWSKQLGPAGSTQAPKKALSTLCHTIMNSAGLLYID